MTKDIMPSQSNTLKMQFTNPSQREPVRKDFPKIAATSEELLYTIDHELKKRGTSPQEISHINIFYPQKRPDLDPHSNGRTAAKNLQFEISEYGKQKLEDLGMSHISWHRTDCIYEERQLNRSDVQTNHISKGFLSSILKRQHYSVDPVFQESTLPLLTAQKDKNNPEYFILTDHMFDRGRTFANMINFIESNGGIVLAAHAFNIMRQSYLAQIANSNEKNHPATTGCLRERVPELVKSFAESASGLAPDDCVETINTALAIHGLSLTALTHEECRDVEFLARKKSFSDILEEIRNAPVDPV